MILGSARPLSSGSYLLVSFQKKKKSLSSINPISSLNQGFGISLQWWGPLFIYLFLKKKHTLTGNESGAPGSQLLSVVIYIEGYQADGLQHSILNWMIYKNENLRVVKFASIFKTGCLV